MAEDKMKDLTFALSKTTLNLNAKDWKTTYDHIYNDDKLRYNLDNLPVAKGGVMMIVTRIPGLFTRLGLDSNFKVAFMSYLKSAPNGEDGSLVTGTTTGSATAKTAASYVIGAEEQQVQDLTMTFKHDSNYIMAGLINLWVNSLINLHTGESEVARKLGEIPTNGFNTMDYLLVKNSTTNFDGNISSYQFFRNVAPTKEVGSEELEVISQPEIIEEISTPFAGSYVHRSTLDKMVFKDTIPKMISDGIKLYREACVDAKYAIGDRIPPVNNLIT